MLQNKRKSSATVSLFPFLSILACVMGTLTLIICGLVFGQIETTPSPEEYLDLNNRINEIVEKIEQLKSRIATVSEQEQQISALKTKLNEADTNRTLMHERDNLIKQIQNIENKLTSRQQETTLIKEEIKAKRKESDNIILVKSNGLSSGLNPTFVECTIDELTIYPSAEQTFTDYIEQIKNRKDACVVFLIRPDGVAKFEAAQKIIRKSGIEYGYMPLPKSGKVDLSLWGIGESKK